MSNNRTEFQRDQITRKSVFVRNKRMAPAPPLSSPQSVADEIDGGVMSSVATTPKISLKTMGIQGNGTSGTSIKTVTGNSSKVATENKINLCKTKYMTTERPHFLQQQQQPSSVRRRAEKWENISHDNKLHIQEHDTPISNTAIRPSTLSTTTTTPEDDTSMNMLLQLEKQINRMEFDTRVTAKSEVPSPTTPVTAGSMRKPIQYTGMESLLNTGVSNVATEGGIGYLEISSNKDDDDNVGAFKRNTDVRQSVGIGTGDRSKPPSGVKQCRPVQRTASDTNQMKVIAMAKRSTDAVVTDGKKVSPLPPPRTATTSLTSTKLKSLPSKDEKFRPTDVRKFVEEHMKSRKVNTKYLRFPYFVFIVSMHLIYIELTLHIVRTTDKNKSL